MTTLFDSPRPSVSPFLRVLKACIQEPSQVASICPSLPALNQRLATKRCFQNASMIVEIGPGNGETTREILCQLPCHARLLAIEKTEAFIDSLRGLNDERLIVRHGDAIDLVQYLRSHNLQPPDVVVSGVPFSALTPWSARQLIHTIFGVLPVGGQFVAYQFRDHVAKYAFPIFGHPDTIEWVWKNLPPLRIYQWTKSS